MNYLDKKFLTILKYALAGQRAEDCDDVTIEEWNRLFKMASIHNVLPLFFESVYGAEGLRHNSEPFVVMARRRVMQDVMVQAITTEEFLRLYNKLLAGGVKPLVVKGIICRNLYSQPDHRQSGDEDVWVQPELFKACHDIMTKFGMSPAIESEDEMEAYEVPYRKQGSPLHIELHKSLFPPESDAYGHLNDYFKNASDRAVAIEIQGNTVYTLDYTDNIFYLICHAFKHFLHSGFGIRQVADIIMFANEYGSMIEWDKVLENCREIHADLFAAAMFKMGEKYLNFDSEKACFSGAWKALEVDETDLLEDLLSSGVFGASTMSRKHSSNITLDAAAAHREGKEARVTLRSSLFPPKKSLEDKYTFLKKMPFLLPVAWGMRIAGYVKETGATSDNSAADALKIGKERVELMKKYGIIK